jgi:ribonuclease BN (tRNA processing enzyme)
MQVRIIGSGDAFGSGGRFNTCLHLTGRGDFSILLDCGVSSLIALNKAGIDRNGISTILVTHFHGDHFGGLPFFILDAQYVARRTAPLLIAGPIGVATRLHTAMEAAFSGASAVKRGFEIHFQEVVPGSVTEIAGAEITAFAMVHDDKAGPCQGYRVARDKSVFAFSGDTGWTETLIPLARGADVLLIECYSADQKLPIHLDWETLAARLPDLTAKRIILTHMNQSMLDHHDTSPVERAEDGMVILL